VVVVVLVVVLVMLEVLGCAESDTSTSDCGL